jgi:hypothetical protein
VNRNGRIEKFKVGDYIYTEKLVKKCGHSIRVVTFSFSFIMRELQDLR